MILAILNGIARDALYLPLMSASAAYQISTVILLLLFSVYFRVLTVRWPLASANQARAVGGIWLLMTLAFETGLGRYATGLSWQEIMQSYNISDGNLWVLVPVWVFIGPYLFFRIQARTQASRRAP